MELKEHARDELRLKSLLKAILKKKVINVFFAKAWTSFVVLLLVISLLANNFVRKNLKNFKLN